ncbi:hypothetical protein [Natronosalvus halobius]|uniref:hypothetical protein n=1 Tax=Natronosalvus halobius TaxID=2953746 RepID=UPI0020A1966F|nr:hypothetical protein [Natronosalvus halobius]USZ71189.1 hypothetical protein NGM15_14050 [Natronosalvus halobius]
MTTRRSLLRKIGLTGIGTATGIALLPTPPHSTTLHGTVEGTEPPTAAVDWIGTEITTEDETPVCRYHYAPTRDGFVPTAPFNVVLIPAADGEAGLERVMTVLDEEGWVRNPVEYTRFAWNRTTDSYVRQQATAAQTYWGASGRRHVRCWSFEDVVSMQAHEDTGARPKHGIASYRRGRETIEAIFDAAGWRVSPGAIDLTNESGPDHDGRATLILEDP